MIRHVLLLLAALGLVLGACGDDDDSAGGDDTDTTVDDGSDTTVDDVEEGGASGVTIEGFAFDPSSIEASVGDTVAWTNEDGVTHTVTAGTPGDPSGAFDESVSSGGAADITFDEAGTFAYFCNIHPSMTGEVVVS